MRNSIASRLEYSLKFALAACWISIAGSSWAKPPRMEFELGAGAAVSDELAPAVSARIGLAASEHFTVSVRGLLAPGSVERRPGTYGGSYAIGYAGRAFLGELRFHSRVTPGFLQPFAALGVGIGELYSKDGDLSHYEQLTFGLRFFLSDSFWASFEVGVNRWNGLAGRVDGGGSYLMGGVFLLSVGFGPALPYTHHHLTTITKSIGELPRATCVPDA